MRGHRVRLFALAGCLALLAAACRGAPGSDPSDAGIHRIRHVIVIMQENRSFDSFFGTFPGADGIPMKNGAPTVCVPNPMRAACVKPFHDPNDANLGGAHDVYAARSQMDNGKMDGFVVNLLNRLGCTP